MPVDEEIARTVVESRETIWNTAGIVVPPLFFASTKDECRFRTDRCRHGCLFDDDALMLRPLPGSPRVGSSR